MPLRG